MAKRNYGEPNFFQRLKFRLFGELKFLWWIWAGIILFNLAWVITVIYIAHHFITKFW